MFYAFIISVHHRIFRVFTLKTFVVNQNAVLFTSKSCWEVLIIAELLQENDQNTPLSGLNQQRREEHRGLSLNGLLFHLKPIRCLQLWIVTDCAALSETATSHNHLQCCLKATTPPLSKNSLKAYGLCHGNEDPFYWGTLFSWSHLHQSVAAILGMCHFQHVLDFKPMTAQYST